MSFSRSNLTSGDFLTNLTKMDGIATDYNTEASAGRLYYSKDPGTIWCLAKSVQNTKFVTALSLIGTNGCLNAIAGGIDNLTGYPVIYYSTASGQTWNISESGLPGLSSTEVYNIFVNIIDSFGVIAVETATNNVLLFWSIDGGNNWSQSINDSATPPNIFSISNAYMRNSAITLYRSVSEILECVYILTLLNNIGDIDIYTSKNGGKNIAYVYTITDFNIYPTGLSLSGPIALIAGYNTVLNSGYVYKSLDTGLTWSLSINNIPNTIFKSVSLSVIYANDLTYKIYIQIVDKIIANAAALDVDNSTCNIYNITNLKSGDIWNKQVLPVKDVTDIVEINVYDTCSFIALKTASLNIVYYSVNSGINWKLIGKFSHVNINDISLSNISAILGTDTGIYYYILSSKPQQYANEETIILANDLLPVILEGYTKEEVVEILNKPENQNLVDLLRQFCNQTYKAQIYRNNGGTYCCYQVKWDNVGKIRNIDPRNMWNLNYLLFTTPDSANLSMFIFAVLYVVKWNLRGYLRQTLNSQGSSYCAYTGSVFPL
jgi:hypothetical protein